MLFCMRVMVGVIILYDHVHPVGAFAKTSKIDVSALILDLKLRSLPSPSAKVQLFERSGGLSCQGPGCFPVLIGSSPICR